MENIPATFASADLRPQSAARVNMEYGSPSPLSESSFIPFESDSDASDEDLGSGLGLTAISHVGTTTKSSGLVDSVNTRAEHWAIHLPASGQVAHRLKGFPPNPSPHV